MKVYLSKLFRKVGVKDRYKLALYGMRNMLPEQVGLSAQMPLERKGRIGERNSQAGVMLMKNPAAQSG